MLNLPDEWAPNGVHMGMGGQELSKAKVAHINIRASVFFRFLNALKGFLGTPEVSPGLMQTESGRDWKDRTLETTNAYQYSGTG